MYVNHIGKMKNKCASWSKVKLSLLGRLHVITSYIIIVIIYAMRLKDISEKYIRQK